MDALPGYYLRLKPQDNMLNFLFDKARKSSFIQSTYSCMKMFLWATFTLYSIKYAILDTFWAFFWKYCPLEYQEYLYISC